MKESFNTKSEDKAAELSKEVEKRAVRKMAARREKNRTIWFGLGMFGIVGWSVAIPTLTGIALGVWIDKRWPSPYSWSLMLLFIGLITGCLNAWYWVKQTSRDR